MCSSHESMQMAPAAKGCESGSLKTTKARNLPLTHHLHVIDTADVDGHCEA